MKKIVIYNDSIIDYIDNNKSMILEYLESNNIDPSPSAIEDAAAELLDDDYLSLFDSIRLFDNTNNCDIIARGSLGLWYGRRKAHAKFKSLYDAICTVLYDSNILYFNNSRCALSIDAYHHDGCNKFKFYKVVNGKEKAIKLNDLF